MAAILYLNGSGRLGKEKKKFDRGDSPTLPLSPTPTVDSNSKSNMVGWINNHELIMLVQPYKISAVHATVYTTV